MQDCTTIWALLWQRLVPLLGPDLAVAAHHHHHLKVTVGVEAVPRCSKGRSSRRMEYGQRELTPHCYVPYLAGSAQALKLHFLYMQPTLAFQASERKGNAGSWKQIGGICSQSAYSLRKARQDTQYIALGLPRLTVPLVSGISAPASRAAACTQLLL